MTETRKRLVGFGVMLGVGVVLAVGANFALREEKKRADQKEADEKLSDFLREEVKKFSLIKGGSEIIIERVSAAKGSDAKDGEGSGSNNGSKVGADGEGGWRILKPVATAADGAEVVSLLDEVAKLKRIWSSEPNPSPGTAAMNMSSSQRPAMVAAGSPS